MSKLDQTPNLSRKEREREQHRVEILEAAEQVFTRKGFYAATVEEIAQQAEFGVGTLYNFFNGKEDLYTQVLEKLANDLMEQFKKQVLGQPNPSAAIGALIKLRLTHMEEHRGFFRVFFESSPEGRINPLPSLPENCIRFYDQYIHSMQEIFQQGIQSGQFDQFDPLYLALCLEGIISAFMRYWSLHEPNEPLSQRIEKMQESFLRRIRPIPSEFGMADSN